MAMFDFLLAVGSVDPACQDLCQKCCGVGVQLISYRGGTPIAGWFISWKALNGWSGGTPMTRRKPRRFQKLGKSWGSQTIALLPSSVATGGGEAPKKIK